MKKLINETKNILIENNPETQESQNSLNTSFQQMTFNMQQKFNNRISTPSYATV